MEITCKRHRFWLSQPDMLRLDCPCTVELELRQSARYLEEESAKKLAALQWSYMHAGESLPFDTVRAENGRLVLEKHSSLSIDADRRAGGASAAPAGRRGVDYRGALRRSAPLARCRADTLLRRPAHRVPEGVIVGGPPYGVVLYAVGHFPKISRRLRRNRLSSRRTITLRRRSLIKARVERSRTTFSYLRRGGSITTAADGGGWKPRATGTHFSCKRDAYLVRFTVPDDIAP